MRRIDTNDMDMVMSIKGKGNCKRYAFDDYSDRIHLGPKVKVEPIKFYDDMDTENKVLEKLVMQLRKPQLVMKSNNIVRVRCNMTHIWDGSRWAKVVGVLTLSEVKSKYPTVKELMYSKDNETFGAWYIAQAVGNVH